ncbi:MAG: hypothetical protein Q8M83_04710 [bacterium]|nr:hypothetical protein [bacterium]
MAKVKTNKKSTKMKTVAKANASLKKIAKVGKKPVLFLPDECAVFKKDNKPKLALPAKCGIEKEIKISPRSPAAIKTVKRFFDFSLSPRKSFWVGVIFGIAVMSVLVVSFWALLSAQFVWASVR